MGICAVDVPVVYGNSVPERVEALCEAVAAPGEETAVVSAISAVPAPEYGFVEKSRPVGGYIDYTKLSPTRWKLCRVQKAGCELCHFGSTHGFLQFADPFATQVRT